MKEMDRKRRLAQLKKRKEAVDKRLAEIESQATFEEQLLEIRDDFFAFCRDAMGFMDFYEPLHRPLCQLIGDSRIKRKLILLPRGHFKSTIISICFPVWRLLHNHDEVIALCSAANDKAEEAIEEISDRVMRERFQLLFGKDLGHPSTWPRNSRTNIRIPRTGSMTGPSITTYSVESSEVGRHASIMILDDIANQAGMNTAASRDKLWGWFTRQLSVLNPNSELIVVGTRWHWDDPYSRIEKKFKGFFYTEEEKEDILLGKAEPEPLKWWFEKRQVIENKNFIFPTRFTPAVLEELKKSQEDYVFHCFYYNEPTGSGNNPYDLRKFAWIHYDEPEECEDEEGKLQTPFTHIFVDPASSERDDACYSGIVIADAIWTKQVVVKEAILERYPPDELVDTLFSLAQIHQPLRICIEDEAYQRSIVHWLRRLMFEHDQTFQVLPIKIPRNIRRYARMDAIQPFIHNRTIVFKNDMPGREHIIEEFETYPKGPHKDLIAAMTMIPYSILYPPRIRVKQPEKELPYPIAFLNHIANRRRRKHGYMPHVKVGGSREGISTATKNTLAELMGQKAG